MICHNCFSDGARPRRPGRIVLCSQCAGAYALGVKHQQPPRGRTVQLTDLEALTLYELLTYRTALQHLNQKTRTTLSRVRRRVLKAVLRHAYTQGERNA